MYLGEKQIKECPHKTVSRFYDSPVSASNQWRCDWCGQDFTPVVEGASKTVELSEPGTPDLKGFADYAEKVFVGAAETVANTGTRAPTKKKEKSYAS